jgi:MoaA/NifB/PqqE/SkfB family radical SAM enzyme
LRRRLELNELAAFPRCVEVQTVNLCNAHCGVCPYGTTTALDAKFMMQDTLLFRLLEECATHADEMDLVIPYLNNEPFADRRMLGILRYIAKRVRIPVELSTNLALVGPDIARALAKENLVQTLRVSAFGAFEDSYERRMPPLRWPVLVSNLRCLLQYISEYRSSVSVEVILVGTPDVTAEEVGHARDLWEPLGARVHIFGYLDRAGNNGLTNLLPLHQKFARLTGCDLNRPFERMAVRASGECVLCSQDWRGEVVLGNATKSSLEDIWRGPEAAQARASVSGRALAPSAFLCRRCKLAILE